MANCFETIRKRNESLVALMLIGKPFEDLLILIIFIAEFNLHLFDTCLSPIILRNVFHLKLIINKYCFLLRIIRNNALITT